MVYKNSAYKLHVWSCASLEKWKGKWKSTQTVVRAVGRREGGLKQDEKHMGWDGMGWDGDGRHG